MKKQTGITLIALIITIIVLLILAGVTINLTLGEKGIFRTAQRAVQNYKDAQDQELIYLNNFEQEMNNTIKGLGNNNNPAFGTIIKKENNIKYTADGQGNVIPVPVGFTATTGTKETGFVIVNDTDKNEFVWIPVDNIADYKRRIWGDQVFDGDNIKSDATATDYFSETMPTNPVNQQTSVNTYKGYYIGRYEAGDKESTIAKTMRSSSTSDTNTVTVQEGQAPYNFVTIDQAKELAEGLYNKTSNNVTSTLCSSYAWDTALNFIGGTYAVNSIQGNYKDVALTYKDITETMQTKDDASSVLIPTGQTTAVKNIYDMGGNAWEFTTGAFSAPEYSCVLRGGSFYGCVSDEPIGIRSIGYTGGSFDNVVFRITLYL